MSTTPADLVRGIEATIERCFGGVDLDAEAAALGLPPEALRELRDLLGALRDLAAAAGEGS